MSDDAGAVQVGLRLMSETNVARRVEHEMNRRGWSQERLAKEMTSAGHPMHQSSVSKIVNPKDGKRRAISVDDALGFAKVFGLSVEELMAPIETAWATELREALTRLVELGAARETIDEEAARITGRVVGVLQEVGADRFEEFLAGFSSPELRRYLEEMHRWGTRRIEQAKAIPDDLPDEEALARLREVMYGEEA